MYTINEEIWLVTMAAQLHRLANKTLEPLAAKYGLNTCQLEILDYLLNSKEYNTLRDITGFMEINKGYLSSLCKDLAAKGYIVSEKDDADRRLLHFQLTRAGREITDQVIEQKGLIFQGITAEISEQRLEEVEKVLREVDRNMERMLNLRQAAPVNHSVIQGFS